MMNKLRKLKVCDWMLLIIIVLMLSSSIQLEITAGSGIIWVWAHIFVGVMFFVLIGWHLQLHFQWRNWFRLLWKQKLKNTKWLTIIGILTIITAVISTIGWIVSPDHSKIGAVHGKLGFLFVALTLWHIFRRFKFFYHTAQDK